jgi:Ca2+-transporting ATPase
MTSSEKPVEAQPAWYSLSPEAALQRLSSSAEGLSESEARHRLQTHGPNELPAAGGLTAWSILLAQFANLLILILLLATGISAFLGHVVESIAIAVIVLFAILLGFVQEYRAERALEALRRMAAPTALVQRDGREHQIPARELVPGDIILLIAGSRVPADARLIETANLRINESALTGESLPVEKQSAPVAQAQSAVGDRRSMAHAGTDVGYGRGKGLVVATGMHTEFGQVTGMLQQVSRRSTPLQQNLDHVGKVLAVVASIIVVAVVLLGILRGAPLLEMFIFGIALAVAAVPEALPAVVTISLAIGVQRMVRRNALVRRLPAVETLGCTSVICSDKTGTLTKDQMTVRQLWMDGQSILVTGSGYDPAGNFEIDQRPVAVSPALAELLKGGALASDAHLQRNAGGWEVSGDPTEAALVVAAAKAGLAKAELDAAFPRIAEIPFSSESKRMTTLHRTAEGALAYAKGAPGVILESCSRYLTARGEAALDAAAAERVDAAARHMAEAALRVLAVGCKADADIEDAEQDMVFLGLVGMIDPPRPEAKDAIRVCRDAGIKPVMITGDHLATARAVGRELGLFRQGRVMHGSALDDLPDAALRDQVEEIEIYARVSPEHKLRIVKAWQERGQTVAVTGDGVNDAPALKQADIGIAMALTGTDVSKEAADMTLTDDNFASIVGAVEEGRAIFSNIKKYLMYLLTSNIGEIGLIAGTALLGMPLPLTAVQILYVNLATDGLPALALAVDPREPDLMQQNPRDPRTGIFSRPVVVLIVTGGLWSTAVNIGLFTWALESGRGIAHAMTLTFLSLVLIQFFKAYNFRSERNSVFRRPFANKWLNLAILWELALLALIVYLPVLQQPLGTYSLPLNDWLIVTGLALTVVPVLEATKWLLRHNWLEKRG